MAASQTRVGDLIERLVASATRTTSQKRTCRSNYISRSWNPRELGPTVFSTTRRIRSRATSLFERSKKCGWNVTETAESLGIPLSTLKYKIGKPDVRQVAKRPRGA